MAEYLTLPAANLIRVPDGISDEKAVFTEPLAAAVEILEQVAIRPSDSVLIIGDGKLGLLISIVLRLTGSDVLMVGKHPEKLEIWRVMGGATILLDQLEAATDRFDVVVEASGHPSGWALATRKARPRGTIVLKSTYQAALSFNTAPLVIDEITVVGSRCGPFAPALRIMDAGLVDPLALMTGVFPLEDAEDAFRKAQEKETLKIMLKM
jgi:threonine dehydrogenase-like Zn-dependent dehydrogenase